MGVKFSKYFKHPVYKMGINHILKLILTYVDFALKIIFAFSMPFAMREMWKPHRGKMKMF